MSKLGLNDNPTWCAIVLFARNLVNKFSILSDKQKGIVQRYVFKELGKRDPSAEHLNVVIGNLGKLIAQTTELNKIKSEFDAHKNNSNAIAASMNMFLKDFLVSELERGRFIDKFGTEAVEAIGSEEDAERILPKLKIMVEDMLSHYRDESLILEKKVRLLEQTVNVDPLLAPLHNRSALDNYLCKAVEQQQDKQQKKLSVLMIDIDNFKSVNDRYGHKVGDDILRALAKIIHNHASKYGWFVARYGGDELVMVCNLSAKKAFFHADAIRLAVQNYEFRPRDGEKFADYAVKFTISIGVAEYCAGMSSDELMCAADNAMYQVKGTGKNNVAQFCFSESLLPGENPD